MRDIIELIFPLKTYLHIFQLEGYSIKGLGLWITRNFFKRKLEGRKALNWTPKAVWIFLNSLFLTLLLPVLFFSLTQNFSVAFILLVFLILVPFIQIVLSNLLMRPYENYHRKKVFYKTKSKIESLKKTKVIGITGSWGKTSVKDILYQMLYQKYKVLKTPKSYNTLMSIAKVVDLELDKTYDFFICEMGAYKKGEIAEICRMVKPKYGILTGIGEQHLARFGSLQNIVDAKFELGQALPPHGFLVLNGDNKLILKNLGRIKIPYTLYGIQNPQAQIKAAVLNVSRSPTAFILKISQKTAKAKTKLLGESSVQNILAAAALAYKLGVRLEDIKTVIETLEPTPNRLELIKKQDMLILNNTYSSNPEGFRQAVSIASDYRKRQRILVTPGIVELGKRTEPIHKELGRLTGGVFDIVILIGKNQRTKAIESGLQDNHYPQAHIKFVSSINKAQQLLQKISKPNSFVLFENDLPDNY